SIRDTVVDGLSIQRAATASVSDLVIEGSQGPAIDCSDADRCVLQRARIEHSPSWALTGRGTRSLSISDTLARDTGGGGIYVSAGSGAMRRIYVEHATGDGVLIEEAHMHIEDLEVRDLAMNESIPFTSAIRAIGGSTLSVARFKVVRSAVSAFCAMCASVD